MTRIHFVRHGMRDHALVGDPPLTPQGRAEAKFLANEFRCPVPTAIFTSPLARAKETAAILGSVLGIEVEDDIRLRERMNWGDLEGQSFEDFLSDWERCSGDRTFQPTIGDSSIAAGQRIEDFVAACSNRYAEGELIAVTHGGVLADFLLNVFSAKDLNRVRPGFPGDPYSAAMVRECSVTVIRHTDGRWHLDALGTVPHSVSNQTGDGI